MGYGRIEFESRFDRTPAEIWPVLADSNRINEITQGFGAYTVQEILGPDGVVTRHARGRLSPLPAEWNEGFGEWIEGRYMRQLRRFTSGPMRMLAVEIRVREASGGSHVDYRFEAACDSFAGAIGNALRIPVRMTKQVVDAFETQVSALDRGNVTDAAGMPVKLGAARRERFDRVRGRD